jgi:hypothetical protein
MAQVEWNKKEELVAEQAIKHLKKYSLVMAAVAKSLEAEIKLIVKVQEYCYENMVFMKVFQKIIVLFYKSKCGLLNYSEKCLYIMRQILNQNVNSVSEQPLSKLTFIMP